MESRKQKQSRAEKAAWECFSRTGKIGYFLLYRAIQGVEIDDTTKDKGDSN